MQPFDDRLWDKTLNQGVYEEARWIKDPKIIVDVGAYTGDFEYYMHDLADVIYAIEPFPDHFKELEENIKQLELNKVKAFNVAISDKTGSGDLTVRTLPGDHSLLNQGDEPTVPVKTITLEDFMKENGIDHIDILKIDTEGYEREILVSIKPLVSKIRFIIVEDHYDRHIEDLLKEYGYKVESNPKIERIKYASL